MACMHWTYIPQREDLCSEGCTCPECGLQGKEKMTRLACGVLEFREILAPWVF